MYTLLVILFIVVCFFLILVVLLQQGKGADVAAAFGGASSQASFGPRGTTTLMHKLTTGSFVLFVALCIGLSVLTARRGRSVTAGVKGKAGGKRSGPGEAGSPGARDQPAARRTPGAGAAAEVSASGADANAACRSGGIGRRARLRGVWRKPCRFESGLRHHSFSTGGAQRAPSVFRPEPGAPFPPPNPHAASPAM